MLVVVTMNPTPSSQCQLLDHFAIGVQSFMALIALSSLFYKRHREHPRRPLNIWLLDVSKQALGGLLVHSCNVFFSLLAVSASTFQNPCILYFLNVLVDTTVGVLILIFFLKVYHAGYHRCVHERMVMGYYGHPPQWKPWLIQTGLFSCSLFSMKLVVVVLLKLVPGLETLGNWVLSPFHHQPQFEEVFVMLLFPLTMNGTTFFFF
ncbi:hypothetical protein HMI55_006177 [Coelomomyces lativittatus]|nr:hypothetical protein HMI55_006177 [Coelomomyces lativittatus]